MECNNIISNVAHSSDYSFSVIHQIQDLSILYGEILEAHVFFTSEKSFQYLSNLEK
jgi:hypothetical protein